MPLPVRDAGCRHRPRAPLLGADPTSPLRWLPLALVAVAALGGAAWASYLRTARPQVYRGIGHTALAQDDDVPIDLGTPTVP